MSLNLRIHNVGHGQAIHAFTPKGETIVIDLGCSTSFSPLEWLSETSKTIDNLIITHPHGDHIDEFSLIKEMGFKVRQLWRPKWLPKNEVYKQNQSSCRTNLEAYFEMSDRYTGQIKESEMVGNPDVSGGVSITRYSSKRCGISNINNHSCVTVFDYLGVTIVVPGDNEPSSWYALLNNKEFVSHMKNTNIFMASHHGRKSGYCPEIFKNKPNICIVSDGKVQNTDARERYSSHAIGWGIFKRNDKSFSERACLTTRKDGHIDISIGNTSTNEVYMSVESG